MPQLNGQDGVSSNQDPKKMKHGVWGQSDTGYGVVGTTDGTTAGGGEGSAVAGYGGGTGVYGQAFSTGVWGRAPRFGTGVRGDGLIGVQGEGDDVGVYGHSTSHIGVDGGGVIGVSGHSDSGTGGSGVQGGGDIGVYGHSEITALFGIGLDIKDTTPPQSGIGVSGYSENNYGILATSQNNYGIVANSGTNVGLVASGVESFGLAGIGGDVGIYAHNLTAERQGHVHDAYLSTGGLAGDFYGDVFVHGKVTKSGGGFKIDDPRNPANKYLSHSFVESEDMKNIYDGVTILDNKGKAEIELPDWFQVLNKDFRYQLTAIGSAGPNLYIQREITKNHFKIAGGTHGMKVSWQVTGIRKDPWANANRIKVEEEKPRKERGYYLHPNLYKKSQQRGIMWARYPEHHNIGRDTMKKSKELLKNIPKAPLKNIPKAPERTRTQKRTK
jgi:hypothetical protein